MSKRQELEQLIKQNAHLESKIEALRGELARFEPLLKTGRFAELELRKQIPVGLFDRVKGPGRPTGGEKTLANRDEVFWNSVKKLESGCWLWMRSSKVFPHREQTTAKQVAWLLVRGTPPVGRLDTVCQERGCINPDHQS